MTTHRIQSGETLSSIAHRFHTTVDALAKANGISDPNKIIAGHNLQIPDGFDRPREVTRQTGNGDGMDKPVSKQPEQVRQVTNGASTSPSQYPMFAQADKRWHLDPMAGKATMGAKGCAVTSTTMALDGITGSNKTPGEMNEYLRTHGGYDKNGNVNWQVMGNAMSPKVQVQKHVPFAAKDVDAQLAHGKPTVIEVQYQKEGKTHHHFILVTGKTADGKYTANDPAGGKPITLSKDAQGRLVSENTPHKYTSSNEGITFDRGPKANGSQQPVQTQQPVPTQTQTSPSSTGGKELGKLSARWEGNNPGRVAHDPKDPGGASYGTWQISSARGKGGKSTMDNFVGWSKTHDPAAYQQLAGKTPGSKEFDEAWKSLAAKDPKGFEAAQHEFIKQTHYDKAASRIEKETGLDVSKRSEALREVLWSRSVQHGPEGGANVFKNALAGKDVSKMSDEEIIRAVYAESSRKDPDGKFHYFRKADGDRRGLENRFRDEPARALQLLRAEPQRRAA